jgi:hypothetical protein
LSGNNSKKYSSNSIRDFIVLKMFPLILLRPLLLKKSFGFLL